MFRSTIFVFFALFATVFGATFRPTCNPKDLAVVGAQYQRPYVFCDWYLSKYRGRLPNNVYPDNAAGVKRFTQACECLTGTKASTVLDKTKYNGPKPYCLPAAQKVIEQQLGQPKMFCKFWSALPARAGSPIAGLNDREVYNGCQCYNVKPTTTTTTKKPTTTTTKTTTKPTTTTTKTTTKPTTTTTTTVVTTTTTTKPTTTSTTTTTTTTTTSKTTTPATTAGAVTTTTAGAATTTTTSHTTTGTTTSASASASGSSGSARKMRLLKARGARKYSNAGKKEVVL